MLETTTGLSYELIVKVSNKVYCTQQKNHLHHHHQTHCYTPSLKRYIDDGIGVWCSNPDSIKDAQAGKSFQSTLNKCGVSWTSSRRFNSAVFLDMTIWIEGKNILTSMFSKPLTLYLYIPTHSCHSRGIIQGLVHGHFIRSHILCSKEEGILKESRLFIQRLQAIGYNTNDFCLYCYLLKQTLKNTPANSSLAKIQNPNLKPIATFTSTLPSTLATPTKKLRTCGALLLWPSPLMKNFLTMCKLRLNSESQWIGL